MDEVEIAGVESDGELDDEDAIPLQEEAQGSAFMEDSIPLQQEAEGGVLMEDSIPLQEEAEGREAAEGSAFMEDSQDPEMQVDPAPLAAPASSDAAPTEVPVYLIGDSPEKTDMVEEDKSWEQCAKNLIDSRQSIEDQISELTAKLSVAKKQRASQTFGHLLGHILCGNKDG